MPVHVLGPVSGKITYRDDDRVCSKHFVEGQPTVDHPCPAVHMGYNYQLKKHQVRAARKTRTIQNFTQYRKKNLKTEVEQTDVKVDSSGEADLKQTVENLNKSIKHGHDYSLCVRLC